MAGGHDQFKITSVWSERSGGYERVQVAVCGCGRTETVHDSGARAKPPEAMAAKFRLKGWRIAPRRSGDQCPACAAGKPRKAPKVGGPLTPQQKRAAFCRIAGVKPAAPKPVTPQEPKEARMPPNAPPAASIPIPASPRPPAPGAEPPRTPGRDDWRRIREALDGAYLSDRDCYAKNGSDRLLAERLNVPRAWVSEERERAYGPDRCEADGEDLRQVEALLTTAAELEKVGLDLATRAEALGRDVVKLQSRLSLRGVL
ncbi:hypothetical protein [Caulobacter sp.]|uniref:hypothetical protein n=1 Tax=Caulobacter sp. TaxID=78 RepID=UPI003BAE54E5